VREQRRIVFDSRVESYLSKEPIDMCGGAIARRRAAHARPERYQIAHVAAQAIGRYLGRKRLLGRVRRSHAVLASIGCCR
jgi:hypothetical protein